MRRPPMQGVPNRGGRVQYFTYGPLEFNINRAAILAANTRKYRPEVRRPERDWVGPNIDVDHGYVEHSSLGKTVIFATVILDGSPLELLIDGNHRVLKALDRQVAVKAVTLDLEDTLKVLTGPAQLLQQMKTEGHRLGLLNQ